MKPQRGIRDDLWSAIAVIAGFAIGTLVFGADWTVVASAAVGVAVVTIVRVALRHYRAR